MTAVVGSMPHIPGSATGPPQRVQSETAWVDSQDSQMRRSASTPQLTDAIDQEEFQAKTRPLLARNNSANYLGSPKPSLDVHESRDDPSRLVLQASPSIKSVRRPGLFRNKTASAKAKATLSIQATVPYESTAAGAPPRMEARSLQMSDAFAQFTKSISRSPSPSIKNGSGKQAVTGLTEIEIKTKIQNARNGIPSVPASPRTGRPVESKLKKPIKREASVSREKRPLSGFLRSSSVGDNLNKMARSRNSSPPPPRLPLPDNAAPVASPTRRKFPSPLSTSIPQSSYQNMIAPSRPDELVRHIQTLEGEYEKFDAGTTALKLTTIRQALYPFLRDYAHHPSNKSLRPEDLDRRIVIFDRWWRGMLQIISITGERAVALGDRQLLFSAITCIMTRPEWRVPPSDCAPIKDMYPRAVLQADSATSNESGSDFITDSIYHHIRNTFSANLLSQMAYVTTSLSQRTASPSLVAFCGKACAYAFFFSPGVAEILIDLWKTPTNAYQRVLDEFNIDRNANFHGKYEDIVDSFPRCIQSLRFTSFNATLKARRKRQDFLLLPPSIEMIDWKGPWANRWSGRESDLLFIFVKYFHILFSEFLPPGTSNREHICAPAFLQVHSQMLMAFDQVLQRKLQPAADVPAGPAPITFDDVLEAADTTAAALQLPFAELSKSMAENRLIMLLRDYILESRIESEASRQVFLRAFSILLKAAVKRTSMFDQTACFTLCEFTEEALQLILSYQLENRMTISLLDLAFWTEVWKKMFSSHNNMVAIRVLTLLYSIWEPLIADPKRREALTLGWILDDVTFEELFAHWCPMNRAYFMRLLCWRIVRFDGDPSELDLKIFYALSRRLRTIWATFQEYQEKLKENRQLPANTAPSNPAPGRKFLIMTTEYRPPIINTSFSFDSMHPLLQSSNTPSPPASVSEQPGAKKPWKTLRTMIGFGSGLASPTSPNFPPPSLHEPSLRPSPKRRDSSRSGTSKSGAPDRPPVYFKFSLAWLDGPQNIHRPRYLHPPRLPSQAESHLRQKMSNAVSATPTINEADLKNQSLKYAGRALAEWSSVVGEFQGFCEKRMREEFSDGSKIETPALTVESFKKLGLGA
ncbi:MAG: hypothetical protein M1814_003430 [Vezdaea aestivalis]|nr:MAG: hypothetical protein M1814_003430 [Vezdaea aestivalis]